MIEAEITCVCPRIKIQDLDLSLTKGQVVYVTHEQARKSKDLDLARAASGVVVRYVKRCQGVRLEEPVRPKAAPARGPHRRLPEPLPKTPPPVVKEPEPVKTLELSPESLEKLGQTLSMMIHEKILEQRFLKVPLEPEAPPVHEEAEPPPVKTPRKKKDG